MERKLELKDIACYFPHGLHVLKFDREALKYNDIFKIEAVNYSTGVVMFQTKEWESIYRPILRPLSDLYKEIIHNGEKITPIVELAKIERGGSILDNININDKYITYKINGIEFGFEFNGSFAIWQENDIWKCNNQIALFDKLNELKIDYRGLIDIGIAIDVNTLEINPYE